MTIREHKGYVSGQLKVNPFHRAKDRSLVEQLMLVVDDERPIVRVILSQIEKFGLDVSTGRQVFTSKGISLDKDLLKIYSDEVVYFLVEILNSVQKRSNWENGIRRAIDTITTNESANQVGNGLEALILICATNVDLIYCDLGIPGLRGQELLQAIEMIRVAKEAPRAINSHMPEVVIITGGSEISDEELFEHGAAAILMKPFSLEDIRAAAHYALFGINSAKVRDLLDGDPQTPE